MFAYRQPEKVSRWYLAFHVKRGDWWGERLIPGRFSHVSAFAYLPLPKAWLLIDHSPRKTGCAVVWPESHDQPVCPAELGLWTANCSILVADVKQREGFKPRFGFWCVTAVKDLLGSSSGALSPAGLWDDLVAQGATVVYDALAPAAQAGPDGGRPDAERAAGAGTGGPI